MWRGLNSSGPLPLLEVQSSHSGRVKHVPTLSATQSGKVFDGVPNPPEFVGPSAVHGALLTVPVCLPLDAASPAHHTESIEEHGASYLAVAAKYITSSGGAVDQWPFCSSVRVGLHECGQSGRLFFGNILRHDSPMMPDGTVRCMPDLQGSVEDGCRDC